MDKKLEQKEIDVLRQNAVFSVKTKLFGKDKFWKVKHFTLGLMDMQSELYLKMNVDPGFYEAKDMRDIVSAQYRSVNKSAKLCAEVVAITILGKPWKIRLFKRWLTKHLLWNINSAELLLFVDKIYKASNYQDFMTSIALMSVKTTTAKASPIEESKAPTA